MCHILPVRISSEFEFVCLCVRLRVRAATAHTPATGTQHTARARLSNSIFSPCRTRVQNQLSLLVCKQIIV